MRKGQLSKNGLLRNKYKCEVRNEDILPYDDIIERDMLLEWFRCELYSFIIKMNFETRKHENREKRIIRGEHNKI